MDNRLAKTGWFQHGGEIDPNLTPEYIIHSLT